jgi:hypothetical protein
LLDAVVAPAISFATFARDKFNLLSRACAFRFSRACAFRLKITAADSDFFFGGIFFFNSSLV